MNCAVCGATSSGQSVCDSCNQIVGRGRRVENVRYRASTLRREEDISSPASTIWFAILLVVTLGSSWLVTGRSTNAYTAGEVAGNVLAHVMIAAFVTGILKWTAKVRPLRTFLITWTIVVPLFFISGVTQRSVQQKQDLHQALLEFKKIESPANQATRGSDATSATIAASSDGSAASPLRIAFASIAKNTAALREQESLREQKIRDLHMELALTPPRLVSASGIAQSRASLGQYRILLTERQSAITAFEDQNQSYLSQIPQPTRDDVMRGYMNARAPSDRALNQYFAIEMGLLDTFNKVMDIAQKAQGRSRLDRNGKLLLPEPMHNEIVNLGQTIRLETQQEALAKQTVQTLTAQHQQDMEKLLRETAPQGSLE